MVRLILIFFAFQASSAFALERVRGEISRILTTEQLFGGCMAEVRGYSGSASCKGGWVTFDCSGDFNDKSASRNMLETAQMAFALELPGDFWVEPGQTHNGYCVVKRVDLIR